MDSIGNRGGPASRDVDQFQAYHQDLEQGGGEQGAGRGGHHSSAGLSDLIINISSSSSSSSGIQPGQAGAAASAFMFPAAAHQQQPSAPSLLPWPLHPAVPDQERFFFPSASLPPLPPPPPPPPAFYSYGTHDLLYARRASAAALQFGYDGGGNSASTSADPLGLAGLCVGPDAFLRARGLMSAAATSPFGALHAEFGKMTPQEIMDAKALAASKSHSEAERRRRERINAHLARLRSLLPSTTKTDKASLLAEVIQHVKELKRQTSEMADEAESPLPTETDELTVDAASDEEGRFVVRASLCCDDRSDLLPDLIKALKALKLRTRKAEITTLGGRIKHVLLITADDNAEAEAEAAADDDENRHQLHSVATIQDALKAVMERAPQADATADPPSSTSVGAGIKRQRTANLSSVLEHRRSACK